MPKKIIATAAVILALVAALILSQRRTEPLKLSGFIEADEIRVGSRVGGRVSKVYVEEGETVEQGRLLVELEAFDLEERKAQAEAQRAALQATLEKLRAGYRSEEVEQSRALVERLRARLAELIAGPRKQEIAEARAELTLKDSELELAAVEQRRTSLLRKEGVVSEEELDRANRTLNVATAARDAAQERLALLEAGTRDEVIASARAELAQAEAELKLRRRGYRREEITEAEQRVHAAEMTVAEIHRQVEELEIHAPVAGLIEAVELQPGDLVNANAPALSMVDTSKLWVRAYLPEDRLNIKTGQKAEIAVDAFPDRRFVGVVTFISREAEFTPRNIQTPEERSKQVFRIKVTLTEGLDLLRPGMSADVFPGEANSPE